ncbi:hypothetical protein [Pseudomonas sp. B392_1p]|uniref:hypothetical protein n=1 Tax=Pseudomonas sp. B392_1p TaxID=3457507 RepID=UPI003FCF7BAA
MITSLKDTKILIPEIPGDWTDRTRNGHTNEWNRMWPPGQPHRNGLPEVILEPPTRGLYAERIDGAWYWVCGCEKCLGNREKYSYITCHEHDRCEHCGIHRQQITEAPWGVTGGWACQPCVTEQKAQRKAEALAAAATSGHSKWDCQLTDEVVCPYCASKFEPDEDISNDCNHECDVCGGVYTVETEYSVSYTTRKVDAQGNEA